MNYFNTAEGKIEYIQEKYWVKIIINSFKPYLDDSEIGIIENREEEILTHF